MKKIKTKPINTTPPAELKGNKVAREAWKRIYKTYHKIGIQPLDSFYENSLIRYCNVVSSEVDLKKLTNDYSNQINKFQTMADSEADPKIKKLFLRLENKFKKSLKSFETRYAQKRKMRARFAYDLFVSDSLRAEIEAEMDKLVNE